MTTLGGFIGNPRDAFAYLNTALANENIAPFHRRNLPRLPIDDRADALASGVATATPIFLQAGDTITNLTAISGSTPANAPTHWFFALYSRDATPVLLGQTADQANAAWGADTPKTLPLATPVKIPKTGIYWVAIVVVATTVPSLYGCVGAKPVVTGEPALAQAVGTGLTNAALANLAGGTPQRAIPLVYAT